MSLEKQLAENTEALKEQTEALKAYTKGQNEDTIKLCSKIDDLTHRLSAIEGAEKLATPAEEAKETTPAALKPKTEKRTKETKPATEEKPKAKVSLETLREAMKKAAAINREEVVGWIAEHGTLTDVPESEWDALYEKAVKYASKQVDALD